MGLEWRGRRGTVLCYYRKRRVGQRVISEYMGAGQFAEFWQVLEHDDRHKRQLARAQQRQIMMQQAGIVAALKDSERASCALVRAVLLANGFHQHKRQWRRSRNMQALAVMEQHQPTPSPDPDRRQSFREAMNAALQVKTQAGGTSQYEIERARAMTEREQRLAVRAVLNDYPDLWTELHGLYSTAESAMLSGPVARDSVPGMLADRGAEGIRRELGHASAPPLERILIEQIAVAWIDLELTSYKYASGASGKHTTATGTYWDRRLNSAQARYLRAVETLARVRKLAQPTPLQVNIGGQQVNVAGVVQR